MYACGGSVAGGGDDVLTTSDDSLCYAIGAITSKNFKDQGLNLNSSSMREGFDAAANDNAYLSEDELTAIFQAFSTEMRMKQMDPAKKDEPYSINLDTLSYAMGMDIYTNVEQSGINLNSGAFFAGSSDAVTDAAAKLDETQTKALMDQFQQKMQKMSAEKAAAESSVNKQKGIDFLAAKETEDGVKKTDSGLLYKVLKEGSGAKPAATNTVKVHYEGTLIDGTIFDSSIQRGEPVEFPLNRVIPGWTEGVQLMSPGSKYQFYIPYNLAYGERGSPPKIPGGAALIFDVELIEIVK